ncbi:NAD-P-binding protein [Cylindrobasidium torrendii FP15055 ss-10]|uniref:NAD-P-binding protein n=1 Tax=Cylindrobasidium torrendii FP15055 ss-10 TaxID=1314674 RepID=A0A0D7BF41_9AGAR|nr:NAD-P-binding protein [Cylindrobasidium torrendii FP15055 ss-10]
MSPKVIICGAGFIGRAVARKLTSNSVKVAFSGRSPERSYESLRASTPSELLLPPIRADITRPESLDAAFKDANLVVSLVGILQGSRQDFENIQWKGAANVARAAKAAGANLIHLSAIGADATSSIDYARTKALGEAAVFQEHSNATIIRPSLVFGPEDALFNRFSLLSQFLPSLPAFGGGSSLFQPVYVEDIARLVSLLTLNPDAQKEFAGKVIEAGGPDVFAWKELMNLVLKFNGRRRLVLPLPFFVGKLMGAVLEQLPQSPLSLTRDQVESLKTNNIVSPTAISLQRVLEKYEPGDSLGSVHHIVPTYMK